MKIIDRWPGEGKPKHPGYHVFLRNVKGKLERLVYRGSKNPTKIKDCLFNAEMESAMIIHTETGKIVSRGGDTFQLEMLELVRRANDI